MNLNKKEMNLNKKEFRKWIRALRSGEFKQGLGRLQEIGTSNYCCLGVACKVLAPKYETIDGMLVGVVPRVDFGSPKWLSGINRDFEFETGKPLIQLNDKAGLRFDEIADLLEAVYIHKVLAP